MDCTQVTMLQEIHKEMQAELTKHLAEKDRVIQDLQKELIACKTEVEKQSKRQGNNSIPELQNEIKQLKTQVEKEVKMFAEVAKQTKVVAKDDAKWPEVVNARKVYLIIKWR